MKNDPARSPSQQSCTHCWHTGDILTLRLPPRYRAWCCWCGRTRTQNCPSAVDTQGWHGDKQPPKRKEKL